MSDFSKAIRYFIYGAAISIAVILLTMETAQGQDKHPQCINPKNQEVDVVKKCPKVRILWKAEIKKVEVPKVIVKEVVKVKKVHVPKVVVRKVKKKVYRNIRKNHVTLLVGRSDSNIKVKPKDHYTANEAVNAPELDVGIQYLREFGVVHGSVSITKNGSAYLGVGVSW